MKRAHLFLFGAFVAITSSCGPSAHYMEDDVYSTRTPMVPIGTDLRDETDYAAYAYKRERLEEKIEYSADQQRWDNFRNSTVRFNTGWNYNLAIGSFRSPSWYTMNHYRYSGLSYFNAASCMFFGYGNYGYFGYSTAYPGPYYGNFYGNGYYPYNNFPVWNGHYQHPYQNNVTNQSTGAINRGIGHNATINYGGGPRMIRTGNPAVNSGTAVRSSASGTVNSSFSSNRATSVRSNTAVRVNNTTAGTNTSVNNSTGSARPSGTVNSGRPTSVNPGRNTNTNISTPNRGTVTPRSTSPSNGGSRPSGGSTPVGGARGTGRR